MDSAKDKITKVVQEYCLVNVSEFEQFKTQIAAGRSNLRTDFAEVRGSDLIERALWEAPETLTTMILIRLESEEYTWFKTKEGARWFASRFPIFASGNRT